MQYPLMSSVCATALCFITSTFAMDNSPEQCALAAVKNDPFFNNVRTELDNVRISYVDEFYYSSAFYPKYADTPSRLYINKPYRDTLFQPVPHAPYDFSSNYGSKQLKDMDSFIRPIVHNEV